MADRSKIEWTDATWNPITGCSVVSPGCTNCYAMRLAGGRMQHHWSREGLTEPSKAGPVWNGEVRFNEPWLDQPLCWKRPRTIFVCAHGDLFHEDVPDSWIDTVMAVMAQASQHRFQVLTKRAERARDYLTRLSTRDSYPWANVWLGVSAEDQKRAEERIPPLLDTPAAVRFLSAEPLLGPVDIEDFLPGNLGPASTYGDENNVERYDVTGRRVVGLDWVIAGGESGSDARPIHPDWVRSIRDQCQAAGVPLFFKQWGSWGGPWHAGPGRSPDDYWKLHSLHGKPLPGNAGLYMLRVGKKRAGRMLDGRTWDGMPLPAGESRR